MKIKVKAAAGKTAVRKTVQVKVKSGMSAKAAKSPVKSKLVRKQKKKVSIRAQASRRTVKRKIMSKSKSRIRKQRKAMNQDPVLRLTPQEARHVPVMVYRPLPGQVSRGPFAPVLPLKAHRKPNQEPLFVRVVSGDDRNGVGVVRHVPSVYAEHYAENMVRVRFAGGTAYAPPAVVEVM